MSYEEVYESIEPPPDSYNEELVTRILSKPWRLWSWEKWRVADVARREHEKFLTSQRQLGDSIQQNEDLVRHVEFLGRGESVKPVSGPIHEITRVSPSSFGVFTEVSCSCGATCHGDSNYASRWINSHVKTGRP